MSFYDGKSPLTEEQMIDAMNQIMSGQVSDEDLSVFLVNMANRGETVEELTGAARVMREKAAHIKAPYGTVDCCGTGGDKSGTYNISTAVALVAASCGVCVAKHGNRAASSKSGAADVLEVLGVNLDIAQDRLEEAMQTIHFGFLMAPNHHKAMKHVMPVRKALGQRTIFNLLGPLSNPADTRHQLLGVFDKRWVRPIAETLKKLGTKRAWVVHGEDGLDEITTTAPTFVAMLDEEGHIKETTLTPEDFGLETADPEKLLGGSAEDNAQALRAVLEGQKCAYRDIVLANTAAVLMIAGKAEDLHTGMKKAAESIDAGLALQVLKDYIAFSRGN
ncbi:MAG: anthranilate phosphoribosyltransferase [Rhodospirillales bacterium]|nr:anthranilate phosphoribosyltransferase [Alphaproteobacteria bacterium]MCB9980882.1 anthranilate phosphoribosyltransferase [Rhodospirillales bacterium]